MLLDKLQKIGLNEKEAKVYLALLELGETNIERISNKSKIKRTTVYDIIEILKEKGLVGSTIKNKKRYYFANDPRDLDQKLDEQKNLLKKIMPELLSIANLIDKKPKIKFYEGVEGIKEIYLDTLNYPNKPLWAWVTDEIFSEIGRDFTGYYVPKRVDNKIFAYVIAPDTPVIREYQKSDLQSLRKTKINPSKDYAIQVEIDLYGDNKIGIMAFAEKIGLIIESRKLFVTLKSIFDAQWNSLN